MEDDEIKNMLDELQDACSRIFDERMHNPIRGIMFHYITDPSAFPHWHAFYYRIVLEITVATASHNMPTKHSP